MKNSYFKALSGLFALCALLVGGGCDDSDSEVNEKPYAISVSQNEMAAYYKIKAPTAAGAGETVSVEVEVTSENHYLKFVSANGVACEQVAGDTRGGTFEFVMPERDVTLGVIIQEFKPEEYPINAPVSQEYTVAVAKTAVAGEVVDVEIVGRTACSPFRPVCSTTLPANWSPVGPSPGNTVSRCRPRR